MQLGTFVHVQSAQTADARLLAAPLLLLSMLLVAAKLANQAARQRDAWKCWLTERGALPKKTKTKCYFYRFYYRRSSVSLSTNEQTNGNGSHNNHNNKHRPTNLEYNREELLLLCEGERIASVQKHPLPLAGTATAAAAAAAALAWRWSNKSAEKHQTLVAHTSSRAHSTPVRLTTLLPLDGSRSLALLVLGELSAAAADP